MKSSVMEILRQVFDVMDTAEQVGLSSDEFRNLMQAIEREAVLRIRREARLRTRAGREVRFQTRARIR